MKYLTKLMGPQLYAASGRKQDKYVEVNFSIKRLRESRIFNFTGYAWVDQKYQIGIQALKVHRSKTVIHDSDYLAIDEHAEVLKNQGHEVVFVLNEREFSVKNIMMPTGRFSRASASNKRMRAAFEKLKARGVRVRKFKCLKALTRYLDKVEVQ